MNSIVPPFIPLTGSIQYCNNFKVGESAEFGQKAMYTGTNVKSMYVSVEASLKKLRTEYIDLLYVHLWDYTSGIEEVMNGLHHLVAQRKVLYLVSRPFFASPCGSRPCVSQGISDTPAWIVSAANMYAKLTGKTPFVVYQGSWNVLLRDFEREILPMAQQQGMALAPWGVLHGGKLRTDEEEERRIKTGETGQLFTFSLSFLPYLMHDVTKVAHS